MSASTRTVSIVTVTYNAAATLGDTLASVAMQTYPHIEHVLVDGGSTDGTIDLIRSRHASAPDRVTWITEADHGIYDAMNKGVRMAHGQVIGILNSDDFFADDHVVSDIVARLEATSADALYADLVFVSQYHTDVIQRTWIAGCGDAKWGWNPPHPTLYVSAGAYERLGLYRNDFKISADYDFMLRLFGSPEMRVAYLQRVVVRMRNGGESTRNLKANIVGFREAQQSLRARGFRWPTLVNLLRVARKLRQVGPHIPRTVARSCDSSAP